MGKEYGYIRVSSTDQNESRQLVAMENLGIPAERIFIDRKSGKDFERPGFKRLLRRMREGDLLCVVSIDRLGRNYQEVLEQWRILTREKGIEINVLDMPLLDTRREKNLLGAFISDLVLQLLSYIAQTERENIRKRQADGIAAAKLRGVRFGRTENPLPTNFAENCHLWREGIVSGVEAARRCQMARSTFYRKARAFLAGNPTEAL